MQDRLKALLERARSEISSASDPARVEELRIRYLGKKGELSAVLSGMGKLAAEQRRSIGEIANSVKAEVEKLLAEAIERVELYKLDAELRGPKLDVTLPGRYRAPGHRHPVSSTLEEMIQTFHRLGFDVATGPEIELDYFNFEALNLPKDHPARDMQDTFYLDASWLPREIAQDENAVVLRRDSDVSHTPMFHQVEGLLVDEGVTMAELKGTLNGFARAFFGSEVKTRFRPSYFPFTEPSAEMHISCVICGGKGCRVCKGSGWLEILGSGMVHPNVLTAVGYDPERYSGFAFGMGVDRLAMLRYHIDDLRSMFENDLRFLEQFP